MALQLPQNFNNDIQGRDTALVPIVVIGDMQTNTIAISTNEYTGYIGGVQDYRTIPLLLNIPSLRESIDIQKRRYKISNLSLSISNLPYDGQRFSERIAEYENGSLINVECRIYWRSPNSDKIYKNPSDADESAAFQVYFGTIQKYDHSVDKVNIIVEDQSQTYLHKDLPLPDYWDEYDQFHRNWLGSDTDVMENYKNKPIPQVWGIVTKSPCVIVKTIEPATGVTQATVIADNILVSNDDLISGNPLYVYNGNYYRVKQVIPFDYNEKLGQFTDSRQYEILNGRLIFNFRTESPRGSEQNHHLAKTPLAYGLTCVEIILKPVGTHLLTAEDGNYEVSNVNGVSYLGMYGATTVGQQTLVGLQGNFVNLYGIQFKFDSVNDKSDLRLIKRDLVGEPVLDDNDEEQLLANLTLGTVQTKADINWTCWMFSVGIYTNQFTLVNEPGGNIISLTPNLDDNPVDGSNPLVFNSIESEYFPIIKETTNLDSVLFEVRGGDGAVNTGFDGHVITSELNVSNVEHTATFLMKGVLEKNLYMDVKGRRVTNSDEVYNAPETIGHLLTSELGVAESSIPSMVEKTIGGGSTYNYERYDNWEYSFTIHEKINSKKLIETLASASPYIPRFDNMQNFKFGIIPLTQGFGTNGTTLGSPPYTDADNVEQPGIFSDSHTIKEEQVLDFSFSRTPISDVTTKIEFKYNWDYARKSFQSRRALSMDNFACYSFEQFDGYKCELGDNAGNSYLTLEECWGNCGGAQADNCTATTITEYLSYNYDYYGLKEDHSQSTLIIDDDRGKYIREDKTAERFVTWMMSWYSQQHLIMNVTLPLKYMDLEIGDVVQFDKVLGDVLPYGIDYTRNLNYNENPVQQYQAFYPTFIITSTKKSLDKVEISCTQLHELWSGEADEVEGDVIIKPGDFSVTGCSTPVHGCTDPSACNYNPEANYNDGSCTTVFDNCQQWLVDCNCNCLPGYVKDDCEVCGGNSDCCHPKVKDCAGNCEGNAYINACGVCVGGGTGLSNTNGMGGEWGQDCNGDCCPGLTISNNSSEYQDGCGAFIDDCGVCSGGNSGHNGNSDMDCFGDCGPGTPYYVGGGEAIEDICGVCGGDGDACDAHIAASNFKIYVQAEQPLKFGSQLPTTLNLNCPTCPQYMITGSETFLLDIEIAAAGPGLDSSSGFLCNTVTNSGNDGDFFNTMEDCHQNCRELDGAVGTCTPEWGQPNIDFTVTLEVHINRQGTANNGANDFPCVDIYGTQANPIELTQTFSASSATYDPGNNIAIQTLTFTVPQPNLLPPFTMETEAWQCNTNATIYEGNEGYCLQNCDDIYLGGPTPYMYGECTQVSAGGGTFNLPITHQLDFDAIYNISIRIKDVTIPDYNYQEMYNIYYNGQPVAGQVGPDLEFVLIHEPYPTSCPGLMGDANNTGNLSCDDYSLALNWLIEDSCESYLNEGFGGNAPEHCCRVAGLTMPNGTLNDSDLLQLLWVIGQAIGTGNPNYFDCDETGS